MGGAEEVQQLRDQFGLPPSRPGDEVKSVSMIALGPPFPAASFRVNTERPPTPSGARQFGPRTAMGLGLSGEYGLQVHDESGQVVWQAP